MTFKFAGARAQVCKYCKFLVARTDRGLVRVGQVADLVEIPSPLDPPSGCHFHPRCPFAFDRCRVERPALKEIAPGRMSACHLNDAG